MWEYSMLDADFSLRGLQFILSVVQAEYVVEEWYWVRNFLRLFRFYPFWIVSFKSHSSTTKNVKPTINSSSYNFVPAGRVEQYAQ